MKVVRAKKIKKKEHRDKGMVMVWFGLMLPVFLGMGALVIDVGALYSERRQLQNGADAAVMAVGVECAFRTCTAAAADSVAKNYTWSNAMDGENDFILCGSAPLAACLPSAPPSVPAGAKYAHVRTSSDSDVNFIFAPLIDGDNGRKVGASATLAWGAPSKASVLPFVLSKCEVERYRAADGTINFPPGDVKIYLHDAQQAWDSNSNNGVCQYTDPFGNIFKWPSGFGFTGKSGAQEACTTTDVSLVFYPNLNKTYGTINGNNNGNSIADSCADVIKQYVANNKPLILPVMYSRTGSGTNAIWYVDGFVRVEVCAFDLKANPDLELDTCTQKNQQGGVILDQNGQPLPNVICNKLNNQDSFRLCGRMRFLSLQDYATSDFGTGTDYGTRVIKMVG